MAERWTWSFLGFESNAEGRPVQAWFNRLHSGDREEIIDTLLYLEKITDRRWPDSLFDPLVGANGISEIKRPEFRAERNGALQRVTLRIYGVFGPPKHSYTFLHETD